MDTTKPHGFFLTSFLVLMFLGDLTEACSCEETSLQKACCKDDFVMRVKFMSVNRDPDFPINLNRFRIYPIEVFKGPGYIRNLRIISSPEDEYYCGYHHKGPLSGDDYLISGVIDDFGPGIRSCHFAKSWYEVTVEDKVTLSKLAGRDCSTICPN